MLAILDELLDEVPAERRPPLEEQRVLLVRSIERSLPDTDPEDVRHALRSSRHG